jgi:tetrahydromethanopterin S-methyltransferase subunit C
MVSLRFNNLNPVYIVLPFQVSKLYEVVPPILTELGKVICYDIGCELPSFNFIFLGMGIIISMLCIFR